jgi:hypothetical protein
MGAASSLSFYFTRYLGLAAEGGFHPDGPNDCVYTAQGGPVYRTLRGRFVPFAHAMGGGAKIGGPVFQPCTWGWGVTTGAGLDYVLPRFGNRVALRLVQADWQYAHVDFGPVSAAHVAGGTVDLQDFRVASGVVLRFGSPEKIPPVQVSCSLSPETVFVGDPVMVTLQASNLDPKITASYHWASTGGVVEGSGPSITVNTKGLDAGTYTVTADVTQGNKAKQKASCTASFHVKVYDPPAVTCVADPNRVMPGETSLITAHGMSPQNRALTYSFSADSGQIHNVRGNTAVLDSRGVPVSTMTVTCNVVDDLGKPASAIATVTIMTPPPPPPPPAQPLCSIEFTRDRKRPVRVDNEAKGCLDDVALALGREPEGKLILIGHAESTDKPDAAAQRVINTKEYLVKEKGIDASRIELRTGAATGRSTDSVLVPPGASFAGEGTTIVEESKQAPN